MRHEKYSSYFVIHGFLIGCMALLIGLLWWQYSFFVEQTEQLMILQNNYQGYVGIMRKVLRGQKADISEEECGEFLDEDDMEVDSFLVINRQPEYLKESTLNFLKEQQLESLVTHMNFNELQNYTDQLLTRKNDERPRTKKAKIRKSSSSWNAKPTRRPSVLNARFSWPIDKSKFWLSSFYGARRKPN